MATRARPTKSRGKTTTRRTPVTRGGPGQHSGSVTKHAMHEQSNHLGPWLVLAFVALLGVLLNAFTNTTASMLWVIGLILLSTVGLVYSAWTTASHRSAVARWHSVVTAGLTGAWLALCTATGLVRVVDFYALDFEVVDFTAAVLLVVGPTLAGAWNHRINVHANDLKMAELAPEPPLTPWGEAGFDDVRTVRERKVNPYRSEGVIAIRGTTLAQLQNAARRIEVEHGWPLDSLTMIPLKGATSRKVAYSVMHSNPLAKPVPWPGLPTNSKLGLFDPFERGLRGDGEVSRLIVANASGAKIKLVVGTNGSGKTQGEVPLLLETANRGACNILIDPMKGLQSYGDIAGAFHMFITNPTLAAAFLERVLTHVVQARSGHLAREGLKAWSPKSSLRFVRIQLEEVSFLPDIGLVEECSKIVRSVGMDLTVSLQRATFDQLPTTLREQLATVLHYGILTPADAKLALPEDVIDAGARPSQWRNEIPGMHYVVQEGIPLEKQVIGVRAWDDPARTDPGSVNGFAATAERIGAKLHPMCSVTAKALGEIWDNHTPPLEMVRRDLTPGPVTTAGLATLADSPPPPPPTDDETGDDDMPTATADPNAVDSVAVEYTPDGTQVLLPGGSGVLPSTIDLGKNPDPEIKPDPWGPMPPLPKNLPFRRIGEPSDPDAVPREVYEAAMEARLAELIASGVDLINAKDFVATQHECKWSRPSIYDFLKRWSTPPNDKDPSPKRLSMLHTGKGYVPVRHDQ